MAAMPIITCKCGVEYYFPELPDEGGFVFCERCGQYQDLEKLPWAQTNKKWFLSELAKVKSLLWWEVLSRRRRASAIANEVAESMLEGIDPGCIQSIRLEWPLIVAVISMGTSFFTMFAIAKGSGLEWLDLVSASTFGRPDAFYTGLIIFLLFVMPGVMMSVHKRLVIRELEGILRRVR